MRSALANPVSPLLGSLGLHGCLALALLLAVRHPVARLPFDLPRPDAWAGNAVEVDAVATPNTVSNLPSSAFANAPSTASESPEPSAATNAAPEVSAPVKSAPKAPAESAARHDSKASAKNLAPVVTPSEANSGGVALRLQRPVPSVGKVCRRACAVCQANTRAPSPRILAPIPFGKRCGSAASDRSQSRSKSMQTVISAAPKSSRRRTAAQSRLKPRTSASAWWRSWAADSSLCKMTWAPAAYCFVSRSRSRSHAVHEGDDPAQLVERGFDPPRGATPGRAYFTLASGRHFEANVQVLARP